MSTISVYEPLSSPTINEKSQYKGNTYAYAKDKKEIEALVTDAISEKSLKAIILQPTIIYGPFSGPWTDRILGQLRTGDVIIPDNDNSVCNAVHIDDVSAATTLAINSESAIGETFLISGPDYVTWPEFFNHFAASLNEGAVLRYSLKDIKKHQRNPIRLARIILGDPKKAIDWEPMKSILKSLQYKLTPKMKSTIKSVYATYKKYSPRAIYLPSGPLLSLFNSESVVEIKKAKDILGFAPKYSFDSGFKKTEEYIKWAYPVPLEKMYG